LKKKFNFQKKNFVSFLLSF